MEPKKNPKFEVSRNSSLYFSVGLCLMMFITWKTLEYKTYDKEEIAYQSVAISEEIEDDIPITNLNTPPPPPPPAAAAPEIITIVENIDDIEETVIESSETNQEEAIEEQIIDVEEVEVEEVEEDIDVPFSVVESVPVFPGCSGSNNAELKRCFELKIKDHIGKHFRYPDAAADLGMQGKVYVIFTVSKTGDIINIKTRGPDKLLEQEAHRIFTLLPKMTPGMQRKKPVNVPFSIPVMFKLMTQ